jgi:hypothetical protein
MSRTGWFVGSVVFLVGGLATAWFGFPRDPGPSPDLGSAKAAVAAASAKDAFGNRLTGEEGQEPIPEVTEVIDLTQVFEPKLLQEEIGSFFDPPVIVDVTAPWGQFAGCGIVVADRAPPVVMPYSADGTASSRIGIYADWAAPALGIVAMGTHRADAVARYGEETSEPPAEPTASWLALSTWLKEACARTMLRLMPMKGSAIAPPAGDLDN